jgi:hypothetical protein
MPRAGSGQGGQRSGNRSQPRVADWPDPNPGQQRYYGSEQDYPSPPGYRSQGDYQAQADYQAQSGYLAQGDGRAPWEGGLPEPDPALRYREPGPGMPGYRGSRDARYGGDRRR